MIFFSNFYLNFQFSKDIYKKKNFSNFDPGSSNFQKLSDEILILREDLQKSLQLTISSCFTPWHVPKLQLILQGEFAEFVMT